MHIHITAILAFITYCTFSQYVVAESTAYRSLFDSEASYQRSEILPLASQRDFRGLEALAEKFRTSRERLAWGGYALQLFYDGLRKGPHEFDTNHPAQYKKFIDDWRNAYPKSHIPTVLEADVMIVQGFNVRSGSADGEKSWHDSSKRAWDLLMPLAKSNIPDPHVYSTMLFAAKALNLPRDSFLSIYRQGMKMEPSYTHLHFRMMEKFLPKWGGAAEDCVAIAEEAASTIGGEEGDWMYFKLAGLIAFGEREDSGIVLKKFSADKIWRGYDVAQKKYGNFTITLHQRAMIAFSLEDWPRAEKAFEDARYVWDTDAAAVWRNRDFFEGRRLKLIQRADE